jgi:hypothetical protein
MIGMSTEQEFSSGKTIHQTSGKYKGPGISPSGVLKGPGPSRFFRSMGFPMDALSCGLKCTSGFRCIVPEAMDPMYTCNRSWYFNTMRHAATHGFPNENIKNAGNSMADSTGVVISDIR